MVKPLLLSYRANRYDRGVLFRGGSRNGSLFFAPEVVVELFSEQKAPNPEWDLELFCASILMGLWEKELCTNVFPYLTHSNFIHIPTEFV